MSLDMGPAFDQGLDPEDDGGFVERVSSAAPGPVNPGQPGGPANVEGETGKAAVLQKDATDTALDYYLNDGKPPADGEKPVDDVVLDPNAAKPQTTGAVVPITQVLKEKGAEIAAALKAVGLTDGQIAELQNAPTLAGRHGAEIGQLKKDNQQFQQMATELAPVLEFDPVSKAPKGFNGIRLLELATQKFGPDEIQKQLATIGVKLVSVDAQIAPAAANAEMTKARAQVMTKVATDFGINIEGLTPQEIRAELRANVDADDAFTSSIARLEAQNALQQDTQTRMTAQQREQAEARIREAQEKDAGQMLAKLDEFKATIPHFAELEPVMIADHQKYFANGAPNITQTCELLRDAAEGKTIKTRLPKLLALYKQKVRSEFAAELGIPPAELDAIASRQPGVKTIQTAKAVPRTGFNPTE